MNDVLNTLRAEFPGVKFDGGDHSEGFWIRADAPKWGWSWERSRMTSIEAILNTVRDAINERQARG